MPAVRYSLHYEDYSEHLISRFGKLLQMQSLVDMTLMCSSHTLRVHKAVLAASSTYFQDILQKQSYEENSEIIIILKMRFSVLKSLVEFMYCGRTNCLEENIDELVSAAQFLKIKGLSKVSKEGLGNSNRDELPEFIPPVVIKRPLGTRNNQIATVPIEASSPTEPHQAALTSGRVPGDIYANGKDTVVHIPIDIQNAATGVSVQQGRELLGVNGMGQQLAIDTDLPPKTLRPRRGRPSMRQRQMTETCDGVLERAAERALRRREEDSRQAIRHLQDMQIRDYMDRITLTQAVESICGPGTHQSQQEPYLSLDSDLMYMPQNLNAKDNFTAEDSHTISKEPSQPKVASSGSQEQTGLSSAMSQYVNILKNAGLPTDLPILFESGDGSYINVNERVLLDMVQSSEIQYEVIEQPNIIERVIDPAETKSIDDLSKCIERGESLGSNGCEGSSSLNLEKNNETQYDHVNNTCMPEDMFFTREGSGRANCSSLDVTKQNSNNFRQCDESSACTISDDMFYTDKDLGARLSKMSKPSDLELESVSDVHALDAEMRYFTNDAMNDDVKKYYEEQRLGDPEIMAKICSSNLDMGSSMDMPLINGRDSVDGLTFGKDDLGKNVDCYGFHLRESVGTENLDGKTLDCLISSRTSVQNGPSVEGNMNVGIEICGDCPTGIVKECENSSDVSTEVLDKPLNVAVVFEPGKDKQKEFRQIRRISVLPAKLTDAVPGKESADEETTVLNDMPSLLMDDCETEKASTLENVVKVLEAVNANSSRLKGDVGKTQLQCEKSSLHSPCTNIPFAVGLLPLKENISKCDGNSHRKLTDDDLESRLPMKRKHQENQPPEDSKPKNIRSSLDSNIKTMLICFFDVTGIVHSEFVSPGQTVNQAFYLVVLKILRTSVRQKRPALWHKRASGLFTTTMSPDVAPSDFFLFPRIKRDLKGMLFAEVDEVKKKTREGLGGITTDEFKDCFGAMAKKIGQVHWL